MKLVVKNQKQFNEKMDDRLDDVLKDTKKKMMRAAMLVRGDIIDDMARGAKTGETYTLYNPHRTHRASAPGESPAVDTGFLIGSIGIEVDTEEGHRVVGKISASAPYAKHLEFGTRDMSARPFMAPALGRNAQKIERIFKKGGVL